MALQSCILEPLKPKIRHGFFTRQGGVSPSPFASLNASLSRGQPHHGMANRARIAAYFQQNPESICCVQQMHGRQVRIITQAYDPLRPPMGDALITETPGLVIGVLTADCVPILIADPVAGRVAAIHAGWRGLQAGIIEATLDQMIHRGSTLSNCLGAIGPCIAQENYEVGPDLYTAFKASHPHWEEYFTKQSHRYHFDLKACAYNSLQAYALKDIDILWADTYSDSQRFFSCRRSLHEGNQAFGNQMSAICIFP